MIFLLQQSKRDLALLLVLLFLPKWNSAMANSPRPITQRGVALPANLDAEALYEAYQQTRQAYQARISPSDNAWRKVSSINNITISTLDHPDDPNCPYVKMEMVVPVPVQKVCDFLHIPNWDTNMPQVDPYYEGVTIYKTLQHKGADITVCRRRMKRLGGLFGKRDFVFLSVSEPELLGGHQREVATTVSIQTPHIPRVPGYTRAYQDSYAVYSPIENGAATYVE